MPAEPISPPWTPGPLPDDTPAYLAIVETIARDIRDHKLNAGDRLPPQRQLAQATGLHFSTITRAYNEAQHRGLVEARVGRGTFVRSEPAAAAPPLAAGAPPAIDMSMNLPPEPERPELLRAMAASVQRASIDLRPLLRYQPFGGSAADRAAGRQWLAARGVEAPLERLFVCAGTHSVLDATFSLLAGAGGSICCDLLTYTGARSIAALRGITLLGLAGDADGALPESLERACVEHRPAALYCNPVLQNPTTVTQSLGRRRDLVAVARRHALPIIEDDVYGLLPQDAPPAYAALAPELTYHVSGLSKTLGAGLRVAYLLAPDARAAARCAAALRATTVMAAPLTSAVASDWIGSGLAAELLAFVRAESRARQAIVAAALAGVSYGAQPEGFHIWLPLPEGRSRTDFTATLRDSGVGVVPSDAFAVGPAPVEAVRICLGGSTTRAQIAHAFEIVAAALTGAPAPYADVV